jgi:poly(3-hydroxybutyrate) depolymerase
MRLLWLLVFAPSVAAAETIEITQLVVEQVESVIRPELQIDSFESARIEGVTTGEGDRISAGEDGWFLDDRLTGNYAHAQLTVEQDGVWLLTGMAYAEAWVNGELRIGNVYGWKDDWESWEPNFDFSSIPVRLSAGENRITFAGVRWGRMRASLVRAESDLILNPRDATLPDLVAGQSADMVGAVTVINATDEFVVDAELLVTGMDGSRSTVAVPPLAPFGVRKVGFPIKAPPVTDEERVAVGIVVRRPGSELDRVDLDLAVRQPRDNRRVTFVSRIDDTVQYFGFLPAGGEPGRKALVLSLHGAAVEAINQSGSYAPLDWAHVVAPTNRRPFGFDWENWGRLDALEVLELAQSNLEIDSDRVYLTGHSMGGHGTWHLATLHPDRFAAAGPSAGWITYWSYRREPPSDASSPIKDMLSRATLTSRTLEKASNLAPLGLYVLHGAEDDNVPPEQSHLMLERLEGFHRDFVYHEEPEVGHWWDLSDEPGADCVAWAPMFDFFARHRRPAIEEVRDLSFLTPNPAVSSWYHWAGIQRQQRPFEMSSFELHLDPWRARVSGTTANVEVLGLALSHLGTDSVRIELDGEVLVVPMPKGGPLWLERREVWTHVRHTDPALRGAHRNGGFRDAFTNRPQLVYGTQGTAEETAMLLAKARFDAEYLWYQGNSSLDVLPDTAFDPAADPDRNVVVYGNAAQHLHWDALVDSVVRVGVDEVLLGGEASTGDLGVLAIRPRVGSDTASVGIVAGTSPTGIRLTERRPYLRGGFAYPDFTLLRHRGDAIVEAAGFFGNDWTVESGDFVRAETD